MRDDPIRQALALAPFFQRLGPEELRLLHATMRHRSLARGATLYAQGERGNAMVLVGSGRLMVEMAQAGGPERPIQEVGPGEVVGEMACIDPAPRSATVRALEPSVVYELDSHLLSYLRRQAPGLVAAVVGSVIVQLTQRLRVTNERIELELSRLAGGTPSAAPRAPRLDPGPPPTRHHGDLPLVDLDPLRGLDERDLERLASVAPARVWEHRSLLCHEGDAGSSCFLVVAGEVDVVKHMRGKRRRLATLSPGALVGQAALVDHAPRSASLRARGTAVAFELDRSTFERLLARANPLALRFQEEIAIAGIRQLRSANGRLSQVLARRVGDQPPPRPPRERGQRAAGQAGQAVSAARGRDDPLHYVQAALSEWGMKVEDLEEIEFVTPEGLMGANEVAARKRRG